MEFDKLIISYFQDIKSNENRKMWFIDVLTWERTYFRNLTSVYNHRLHEMNPCFYLFTMLMLISICIQCFQFTMKNICCIQSILTAQLRHEWVTSGRYDFIKWIYWNASIVLYFNVQGFVTARKMDALHVYVLCLFLSTVAV